ncbi:MAG: MnmC family methyltransferase [Verrucomicrobia bacterium]|nr:MnmC family methyltransferase [Verrucomicrobiota bacterium]
MNTCVHDPSRPRSAWAGQAGVYLTVFLSGMAALIYEMIWLRELDLVFGVSSQAVASTLATFMLGIGLGSFVFGRRAETSASPLRLYQRLELGIALSAGLGFLVIQYTPVFSVLHALLYQHAGQLGLGIGRLLMAALILFPMTFCMGGTIPVLCKALVRHDQEIGRRFSSLYAINTLGAVVGTLLAGLVLVRLIGVRATLGVAMCLNIGVAILMGFILRNPSERVVEPAPAPGEEPCGERAFAWVAGVTGFMAMGFQIVWLRVLTNYGNGTTYAFTLILAAFLAGILVGTLLITPLVDQVKRGALGLAVMLTGLSTAAAGTLFLLAHVEGINSQFGLAATVRPTTVELILQEAAVGSVFIFITTLFFGMIFPLALRLYSPKASRIGQTTGRFYLANSAGLIIGSLVTTFILIPGLGVRSTSDVLIGLGLLTAAAMLIGQALRPVVATRLRSALALGIGILAVTGGVAGVVRIGAYTPHQFYNQLPGQELFFYGEGASATVSVLGSRRDGALYKNLCVDGHSVSGDYPELIPDPILLAHVPILLATQPVSVVTVGLGTAGTSYSMSLHDVQVTAVEIEPQIIRASAEFPGLNGGVLGAANFEIVLDDVRSFLQSTDRRFDVIVTDVTSPKYKRNAYLYTVEYFEVLKQRLAPGGIAATWAPYAGTSYDDLLMMLASFDAVFPYTSVWAYVRGRGVLLMFAGSLTPITIDLDNWASRFEPVRDNLARIGIHSAEELAAHRFVGEAGVDTLIVDARLNRDNQPHLEFSDLDSYMRVNHWRHYRHLLEARETDSLVGYRGSPERMARLRTAQEDVLAKAAHWGIEISQAIQDY